MLAVTFKIAAALLVWGTSCVPVVSGSCDSSCPDCPCFSQASYTIFLPDNIQETTPFVSLTATSPLGLPITYTLVGSAQFAISLHTGMLSTRVELDYNIRSSYMLTVRARDSAGHIGVTSVAITLILSSSTDTTLICTSTLVNAQVPEGITDSEVPLPTCFNGDGSVVSDLDLVTMISGGNIGSLFTLTGTARVSNTLPLDYETQSIHTLQVGVANTETPPRSTTISVIIVVSPVNEHPPVFPSDPIILDVPESQAIGMVLSQVQATDQDRGGGDGTVTYSLIPQSGSESVLEITHTSGEIILTRSLDFETRRNYTFTVVATDNPSDISMTLNSTVSLSLNVADVNDNPPMFEHAAYAAQVPENVDVGHTVRALTCTDRDTVNSDLSYSITAGNNASKFTIDAATGAVSLLERIDYDDPTSIIFYTLTVTCQEREYPLRTSETLFVVEITSENEFRPDPGSTYQVRLREDTPPGTRILQVHGRDRDRGLAGVLRYHLYPSLSSIYTCPSSFYIHNITGTVYLTAPLDFERDPHRYHCIASVWDSQVPIRISEQDIFIEVTDVNDAPPTCDRLPYMVEVAEDAAVGSVVATLLCSDPDSAHLNYVFTDSSAPLFQLDQRGVVTLNGALDYEAQHLHIIHVQVSDNEYATNASVFVTVTNVNEYAPVFSMPPSCSISEDAIQGSPVCTVQATDGDQGMEGVVEFSVTSTDVPFDVQPESGVVFVTGNLDADTTGEYIVQVRAEDRGEPSQSNSVNIMVNIVDVNDNPPVMPANLYISVPENSPIGSTLTTLVCTDSDAGMENSDIQFQMGAVIQDTGDGTLTPVATPLLALDTSTGELSLLRTLDYEAITSYIVYVMCQDQGTPPLATPSSVHVQVTAINEFPPVFSPTTYTATVPEDVTLGTSVLTVSATDSDAGSQGDVLYRIESGMGTSLPFWIHPQTGVISVVKQPQCHIQTSYSFQVVAADGATPPREAQGDVSITIDQCHLGTLTPTSNVHIASIVENAVAGENVLTVNCISSRMPGASPNYRLLQNSVNFEMGSTSGEIFVHTPPDYEESVSHVLNIQCYDPNHPEIFSNMAVHISVVPVNEHSPVFDMSEYNLQVIENTPLGSSIGAVLAMDGDRGRDGEVRYTVSEGPEVVMVDPETGEIYLTRDLDREALERLQVTVTARDSPNEATAARTSSAEVVIHVMDDNDNWPVCNKTVFHMPISPFTQPAEVILEDLDCTDQDTGPNSQLQYSLGEGMSKFTVNSSTGRLSLAESLDPEDAVAYDVPVLVTDGGEVPYSTTVLVIVDLRQPPPEILADERDSNYRSLVEEEGLQNSVIIILPDFSKAIWEGSSSTVASFNEAVAQSVTNFCAIYPEACSLVYGCAQFYGFTQATSRRKRQTTNIDRSSNYANFIQPHVVIIPNMTSDLQPFSTDNGDSPLTSLQIRFYVKLPDQAERSPSRATNYVVPKNTLDEIVRQDKGVISAVVRNTVTSSLTHTPLDGWRVAAVVIIAILSFAIVVSLVVTAIILLYKMRMRNKMRTKVIPISPKVSTSSSKSSSSTKAVIGSRSKGQEEKPQIPAALAHFFSSPQGGPSSPQQISSNYSSGSRKSSSHSSCLSNASMENNASQRGSTSPRRISEEDIPSQENKDKMESLVFEIIDDVEEDQEEEVPFPYTRPVKQVQPPAGNRWSSMH